MLPYLVMGGASVLGGLAKKKAGEDTADAERKAASNAKIAGYFKGRALRKGQEELQSTIRARAGASGVDVTQGSPLEAYLQATRETELDIIHNRFSTDSEVSARLNAAHMAERAGDMGLLSSLIEGGATMYGAKTKSVQRLKLQSILT